MSETTFPDRTLDRVDEQIATEAERAYRDYVRLIDLGVPPRDAADSVFAQFDRAYYEALAAAFTQILGRQWTANMVREYRVGSLPLSARLYRAHRQTGEEAAAIIAEHLKGAQQARQLALALYEGYGYRGVEPLAIRAGQFRQLPIALRRLATAPAIRRLLLQTARRTAATKLRTAALRSAYTQAFDAALQQAARPRLLKLLKVAVEEKNRYFANRIAQTELARAHSDAVAAEFMADATLEVVQWRLSGAHPRADICDLLAKVDRWGLGPGCFPKKLAPKPVAHPFCVVGSTLVSTGASIAAVTQRRYEGNVVVIATASGQRLEATVNHPVLAPSGWIAAGALHVGDQVFRRVGRELGPALVNHDHQDVPARIAEIFDAFGRSPKVATIEVPTAAPDFHGDGMAGEVAVVRAYRELWDGVNAGLLERSESDLFVAASDGALGLPDQRDLHLPLEAARLASACGMRRSNLIGALLGGHALPLDALLFAGGSESDSAGGQSASDSLAGDAELAREIQDGLTGEVLPDEIVSVDRYAFSGHVYNLETTSGHYTSNGIITHNCRCRLRSRPDLSAKAAQERAGASAAYLAGMSEAEAGRLLGSKARAAAVKRGRDPVDVWNAAQRDEYAIKRLGQGARAARRRA